MRIAAATSTKRQVSGACPLRPGRRGGVVAVALLVISACLARSAAAGTEDLTVVSWGGRYMAMQQRVFGIPWQGRTGKTIRWQSYTGGLDEIRRQIRSGNVTWDVVDVVAGEAQTGCNEGLFEEVPESVFERAANGQSLDDDLTIGRPNKCAAPLAAWSYVVFFDKNVFRKKAGRGKRASARKVRRKKTARAAKGKSASATKRKILRASRATSGPATIADFFNLKRFPGKRAVPAWPNGLIEMALVADGVMPRKVYQVLARSGGIDRAFRKLDSIKANLVFWTRAAKALEMVEYRSVKMAIAFSNVVGEAVLEREADLVTIWDGQVLEAEWFAVPKGSKRKDTAFDFIRFATGPGSQARMAHFATYGPLRRSALARIADAEPWYHSRKPVGAHLPNRPAVMARSVIANAGWWIENGAAIKRRFDAWRAK